MRGAVRPAQQALLPAPVGPVREPAPGRAADSTRARVAPLVRVLPGRPVTVLTASRQGATVLTAVTAVAHGQGATGGLTTATQVIVRADTVRRVGVVRRMDMDDRVTARRRRAERRTTAIRPRVIRRGRTCGASQRAATSDRQVVRGRIPAGALAMAGLTDTGKVAGLSLTTARTARVSSAGLRDIQRVPVMVTPTITPVIRQLGRRSDMTPLRGISPEESGSAATGTMAASRDRPIAGSTGEPEGDRKAPVSVRDPRHPQIPGGRSKLVTRRADSGRGKAATPRQGGAGRGRGHQTRRTDTRLTDQPRTAIAPRWVTVTTPTSRITRSRKAVAAEDLKPAAREPDANSCQPPGRLSRRPSAVSQARAVMAPRQRGRPVRSAEPVRLPRCHQARRPAAPRTLNRSCQRRRVTPQVRPHPRRPALRCRRARPA